MATTVQLRRGTTDDHSTFSGAVAEVTVDTDKNVPVVHDGITQGGFPLARESALNTLDSDYGSHKANTNNPHSVTKIQVGLGNVTNDQQVPKAGGTFTGALAVAGVNLTFESAAKAIYQDSSDNVVASIYGDGTKGTVISGEGTVNKITLRTNGTDQMTVDSSGVVRIGGNTVWHAGNDGTGSGLNADSLQGKSSNFFATNTEFQSHKSDTGNPHQVTKAQVGLGNVTNDLQATKTEFDSHTGNTGNPHSVTKSQVGLGTTDSPTFAGLTLNGSLNASGRTASLHKINFDNNESTAATVDGDLVWDLSGGLYTRRGGTAYKVWDSGNDGSLAKTTGTYSSLRAQGTTKGDVGLGNVPNTDATNANNINSGTLPSGRLSGTYGISITGDADSVDGYHISYSNGVLNIDT